MSKWRETYKVHPAADVFPVMSDDELAKLGEDIMANGLKQRIVLYGNPLAHVLLDGRNRLEALERAGLPTAFTTCQCQILTERDGDAVAHIIGLNIHRRHLTKQQQADLIVAAIKAGDKPPQLEEVSKGGRGNVNKVKAKAVAEAKKLDISKATVERSIAKAEGKVPKPKKKPRVEEPIGGEVGTPKPKARQPHYSARPMPKPRSGKTLAGLEAARRYYLDQCADPDVDLDAEMDIVMDALREIAERRP